jgi:hypothetical protein
MENDEDAPPTEEEIKELWRKCRFDLWRDEGFLRGRERRVAFNRAPKLPEEYWNTPVPDTAPIIAVIFSHHLLRRNERSQNGEGIVTTLVTEIRGNGVVVERTEERIRKSWA